jgi:hypothetical protein
VGQQVHVFSPSGETGQGWVMPAGFSHQNPQGHDKAGEYNISIGGTSLTFKGDSVIINAEVIRLAGARVEHNGLNIGASHTHGDVEPGPGNTGVPNP